MESSLAISLDDLRAEVALFLGYDPTDDSVKAKINSIVSSGLRQFYHTPLVPEQNVPAAYPWSFLKPVANLTLDSGASILNLPDDFAGVDGEIQITTSGANPTPIPITSHVRQFRAAQPDATGTPRMAEIEPIRGVTSKHGQRFQLVLWPTADQSYTLQLPYYLQASALTDQAPYALGGAAHTETIIESCLAIAEQRLNNASMVHSMKFHERLGASVALDKRMKPQFVGTMRKPAGRVARTERFGTAVTYNGQAIN